jgi:DNA-directed RNA polymerase specialized sigma24 family protein
MRARLQGLCDHAGMPRRSTPPHVEMPEPLYDQVDLALRRVAGAAEGAAELSATAAGALSRLEVTDKLQVILADLTDLLIAWCVEDVQVSQQLVADVLGVDASTVSRRAKRALPRLRKILPDT